MAKSLMQNSEKLNYFFEVATRLSFQSASRHLGVSAPSLSYAIKELESSLKVKLFTRTNKGVNLTKQGLHLLQFTQKMIAEVNKVEKSIQNFSTHQFERIRFGTFSSIAIYLWPTIFGLIQNHKGLEISLKTDRSKALIDLLMKRQLDMVLTTGEVKHNILKSIEIYQDHYSFYISKNEKTEKTAQNQMKNFNLFYFSDATDEQEVPLSEYIENFQLNFKSKSELESFEAIAEFIKKGQSVGILPCRFAKLFKKDLHRIEIKNIPIEFGLHRFYINYRMDSDIKKSTVDLIIEASKLAIESL